MSRKTLFSTSVFSTSAAALLALASLGTAAPAHAGDVSNAQLSCYVDTNAWDYASIDECVSYWTPWTASNPSQAIFEVVGLTSGSYTFYWTDLSTGQVGVCATGDSACFRSIRVGRSKTMRVTVIDNQTAASKTVVATAYFEDGWN